MDALAIYIASKYAASPENGINQVFGDYLRASESASARNTIKEPEKNAKDHWKDAVPYADELNKRLDSGIAEIKRRSY